MLDFLGKNYILSVVITAWILSQLLKMGIELFTSKKFDFERIFGAGGMPSVHTATVVSLTVAVARKAGLSSSEFAISLVLAGIVMYDAMNIRREAGEHARILNKVVNWLFDKHDHRIDMNNDSQYDEKDKLNLQELLGHTPLEVLGGALLGALIAYIIPLL